MHIAPRGKKFTCSVYKPGGGRVWVGSYPTRAEARKAGKEAEAAVQRLSRTHQETVAEFANRWTDDFGTVNGEPRWGDSALQNLEYAKAKLVAEWGPSKIGDLPDDRRFLPWLRAARPHNVKVYRSMFKDAVASGVMDSDPTQGMKLETSRGRRDIEAITEDELAVLADCARQVWPGPFGEMASAFVTFQGTVGTRPIALRHLRADDVDLPNGSVYLRHPGKNVAPRTVALFPAAVEALSRLPRRIDSDYLFTTKTGNRLGKSSCFYLFQPIRVRFESELPAARAQELRDSRKDGGPMALYELRHAAATSMRRRGATWEQIAHQLCQTDGGEQARKTYSHLTEVDHLSQLRGLYGQNVTELRPTKEAHGG